MRNFIKRSRRQSLAEEQLLRNTRWAGFYQKKYGHGFDIALWSAKYWNPWATEEQLTKALLANGVVYNGRESIYDTQEQNQKFDPEPQARKEARTRSGTPDRREASTGLRVRRSKRGQP